LSEIRIEAENAERGRFRHIYIKPMEEKHCMKITFFSLTWSSWLIQFLQ